MPIGQLRRSISGLHVEGVRRARERQRIRDLEGLMEREEQFKIDIAGRAEEFPIWSDIHLKFGIDFVDATGQRDSPYDRPHFTYGVYIASGGPVGILACVTRWDVNDRNETTGCVLALGPVASDVVREFTGEVHARFQGYGAPTESYGDPSQFDEE